MNPRQRLIASLLFCSAVAAGEGAGGLQDVFIKDPTLGNLNAFRISIPVNWHFQGTLYEGGNCAQFPASVFRSTSPEGLSVVEVLPPLGWLWGSGPRAQASATSDCLPLKAPMSAEDFLKNLATTMKWHYDNPEPVPADLQAKVQGELRQQPLHHTVDLAQAIVSSTNGTYFLKGVFKARVDCNETTYPGMKSILRGMADTPPSTVHQCTGAVSLLFAPEAKFTDVRRLWDQPGIGGHGGENEWFRAYVQRSQQRSDAMIAQGNRMAQQRAQQSADQYSALQDRAQQFSHDQAVRQQMHEQFLGTLQRGTDQSMARAQATMNARSSAASDWVDYALDRQTVVDPATGQVSKVSSAYTNTWVDSSGKNSYQTNDANANPNGVLPGTWTQQKIVHGNATP